MNINDKRAEARDQELQDYFHDIATERLKVKGYIVPSIGDHQIASSVFANSTNDIIKRFCKVIISAFNNKEPLHPRILQNLYSLRARFKTR